MKSSNVKGMSFGFSAVNAGQRNVSIEPQLIAVSTDGGFRMTPPVSRALGIGHGDYAAFANNIQSINDAIANNDPVVVAFCEENGYDIASAEAAAAIHKEFDMWAVYKGIAEKDAKGLPKTTTERLTKADKIKFASLMFDDMMADALENANDEVKEALTREGITKEEQIDILAGFVKPRVLPKFSGSKVANPGKITGVGTSVTFTDTNVWNQLKADMGDEASTKNREFAVDVDNLIELPINNGYEIVTVKAIVLGDYTDKEPARVGEKE